MFSNWGKSSLLTLLMLAMSLAIGCNRKKAKPANSFSLDKASCETSSDDSAGLKLDGDCEAEEKTEVPAEEAPTELLQKAVARVLAFVDVENKSVTIYQDAYSALFKTIARQKGEVPGTTPDPIFYFSPVVIADIPEMTLLPNGNINISINNRYPPAAVRKLVEDKLSETLANFNLERNRVGLVPLEG